jgi:hypothetical protein
MKRLLGFIVVVSLLSLPLMAQNYPKAEIFGGYQYLRVNDVFSSGYGFNANGWAASLTGNVNQWLGVTGDFGGAYKSVSGADLHIYTYSGGPVVNLNHSGVVNPFVHALFGGARAGGSATGVGSGGTNGFTMMYGGGADVKMNRMLALRGQVDWQYFRFSGVTFSKNVRVSTGIVLRF